MPNGTLLLLLQTVQVQLTWATHLSKILFIVGTDARAGPLNFLRKVHFLTYNIMQIIKSLRRLKNRSCN